MTLKRTAKWHKHLTMVELRHLKEMESLSLTRFKRLRESQARQKAQLIKWNDGKEEGTLTEPCWECRHIETKLRDAGVLA